MFFQALGKCISVIKIMKLSVWNSMCNKNRFSKSIELHVKDGLLSEQLSSDTKTFRHQQEVL